MNDKLDTFLKKHAFKAPSSTFGHEKKLFQILAQRSSHRKRSWLLAFGVSLGAAAALSLIIKTKSPSPDFQEEILLEEIISSYDALLDDEEPIYLLSQLNYEP